MGQVAGEGLWPGAVAVSGGADSTALMVLLVEWSREAQREKPVVLTVDHGLVPNSDRIADDVLAKARTLGLEAHALVWRGHKPKSDIENIARKARYRLMGDWCGEHDIRALFVAHTLEDQAETFLLRLARGSGVDGLAAMQMIAPFPVRGFDDLQIVRPLLNVPRARVRALLVKRQIDWHEDAMNTDTRYARVRLRATWLAFEAAGLSAERIAQAAKHLARAREALDCDTAALLATASKSSEDYILMDHAALAAVPREIGLRAIAHALMRISARDYRPRFERLESLFDAICVGSLAGGRTLHGCVVRAAPKRHQCYGPRTILIGPEPRTGV